MKQYSAYKDSGIDLIGKIPINWSVKKLKFFSRIVLGKMLTNEDKGGYFYKPYLRAQNLNWFNVNARDIKSMWISENELSQYRIKKDDLLVSEGGEVGRTCMWNNEIEECYIQNSVHKVTVNGENIPRFFQYFFFILGAFGHFEAIVSRVSIAHLTREKLKEVFFIFPDQKQQSKITTFLDYKTKQIDDLITKKQKLIDLLKDECTALINQVVTKGLDINVRMKDSGIEWLSDVPDHWEQRKLKFIAECNTSNVDKHSKDDEKIVSLCNYTDVYKNDFIHSGMNFMSATAGLSEIENFTLKEDDVLITKDSETPDDIAIPAYVTENLINVICGYHLAMIRSNKNLLCGKYLFYLFKSYKFNQQFTIAANGITRFGLGISTIRNSVISIPSKSEQLKIVEFLDQKSKIVEISAVQIEKEITLLLEYKTSLINEAVTGKIDVRDYKINASTFTS